MCVQFPSRSEEGTGSLKLDYWQFWATMWVLAAEPGSFARVASGLNHWTFSPALCTLCLYPSFKFCLISTGLLRLERGRGKEDKRWEINYIWHYCGALGHKSPENPEYILWVLSRSKYKFCIFLKYLSFYFLSYDTVTVNEDLETVGASP